MEGIAFFAIFATIILPILLIFLVARMLIRRRDAQGLNREEQARFQAMWESLQRMEDRIANLETILMEKNRPAGGEGRQ
jgi:phage shock protein B